MLSFAISGVALLKGASAGAAIGLWALLTSAEILCLIIEGLPGKYNTSFSTKGIFINLWVCEIAALANLLNLDWAPVVNKVLAVLAVLTTAVSVIAPQKVSRRCVVIITSLYQFLYCIYVQQILFDPQVWGTDEDEEALTTLAINNWAASNAGIAALIIPLVVMDAPPSSTKMVGYTHVPFTLLSVYNAIFSKAAKEIMVADGVRYFFAAVMTVLVSATLL